MKRHGPQILRMISIPILDKKNIEKVKKMAREVTAYQIKISLLNTQPLVWRRLEVVSNMSLNVFALAINDSVGWESYHLHLFDVLGKEYGPTELDDFNEWKCDKAMKLYSIVDKQTKFKYTYDFGDNWIHEVEIEKEVQALKNERYPKCIAGGNACPPEDCGGITRFDEYKKIMNNKKHPEYQEMFDWRGDFHVKEFSPTFTNYRMMTKKIPSNYKIRQIL
jgi:hypothetical protein